MTQKETVLRYLRTAGRRGVHTFELRRQFIGNPSQRIAELEADGHVIVHHRERLNGKAVGTRYTLLGTSMRDALRAAADIISDQMRADSSAFEETPELSLPPGTEASPAPVSPQAAEQQLTLGEAA